MVSLALPTPHTIRHTARRVSFFPYVLKIHAVRPLEKCAVHMPRFSIRMIRVRDSLFRMSLKLAYWGMRVVWFLTRRPHSGGAVAVWSGDRLLTVRESYRNCFSIPGGGTKGEEEPIQAAIRELREEVGIAAKPEDLRPVLISSTTWEDRRDAVHVFEYRPLSEPAIAIDNREIVWADYCLPSRLRERPASPHLDDYLRHLREKADS